MNLLTYSENIYSQCGEDGILREVFRIIGLPPVPWCIDVGAGDGVTFSNVRNLILQGWEADLFEAKAENVYKMQALYKERASRVWIHHAMVGWGEVAALDVLIRNGCTAPARGPDFLSLDVDGCELPIWQAIRRYKARVCCVEFNPTWPIYVSRTQEASPAVNKGASLAATVACGKSLGYELVCVTHWNAIFVRAEEYGRFDIDPVAPNDHRILGSQHPQLWTYTAWDYDGTEHRGGPQKCGWGNKDGRYEGAAWHGVASGQDQYGQVMKR